MIMSCGSCGASILGSYWFIYGHAGGTTAANETQLAMIAAAGTVLGAVELTFDLGPAAFLKQGCDPDMRNGARIPHRCSPRRRAADRLLHPRVLLHVRRDGRRGQLGLSG